MKSLGVRAQLLLVLLVPLAIFGPLAALLFVRALENSVAREVDARGELLARQTASLVVDDVLTGNRLGAERRLVDVLGSNTDLVYLFVMDVHGRVLAHTFPLGFPADLLQVQAPPATQPVALDGRLVHDVRAPILGGVAGAVHLGISTDVARAAPRRIVSGLALVGGGVVTLGVFLALLFSARMLRRLERVAAAAARVGAGDFAGSISDGREDEIGRLCDAFDTMAVRLRNATEERERTGARMAQSERLAAVGRLAAGVAHEINNPLSGVRHCLDNLRADDVEAETRREYYELMSDGVSRAQRVIRGLLDFSRPRPLEVVPTTAEELVLSVTALAEPALRKSRHRTETRIDPKTPTVLVDRHQMTQVLLNLVLNAAEAMTEGGVVHIETTRQGEECRIAVQDTGCGIPEDQLAHVFEPFFTTKSGGTGLGLSVSLGIVERHGGRLVVDSTVGKGTRFEICLPAKGAADG